MTAQSWEEQPPPQPRAGTPLSPLHPSSRLPSGVTLSATLTHPAQLSLSPSWCLRAGPPTEAQLPRPCAPPTLNPLWIPSRPCTCYSCFLEHASTALPSQQLLDQPVRTSSTFYEAPPGTGHYYRHPGSHGLQDRYVLRKLCQLKPPPLRGHPVPATCVLKWEGPS